MAREPARRSAVRRRRLQYVAVGLAGGAMWYVASGQFTSGVFDLVIFAPPAAALGLAATWAGHVFVPERFTWRRGLAGALIGAVLGSPAMASLIAFSAAWNPQSFQFVFNVGAWVAFAIGSTLGAVTGGLGWVIRRRRRQAVVRDEGKVTRSLAEMPDANDGLTPTPACERIT
jgi:hypothetical protein